MKSPRDVYEKLGRGRVQSMLGLTPGSMTDAIAAGAFPARWYAPMKALADADGVDLPLGLFNWREPAARQPDEAA